MDNYGKPVPFKGRRGQSDRQMQHFQPGQAGSWGDDASPRAEVVQAAALCLRDTARGPEVLMITSLRTRRWILPKGWPMADRCLAESARQEAWEEAGVIGRLHPLSIGYYQYRKQRARGLVTCRVEVFRIDVETLARAYPERGRRRRRWMTPDAAAGAVLEPDLQGLLRRL